MENLGHKKNKCEEKNFPAKNGFEKSIKKMWGLLIKVKF